MKPFTVKKINDYTWQIAEVYHLPAALPMYLIIGEDRAALIDTGTGMPNLRETVEEITSLPVSVYNTHAHIDHAAGDCNFDSVYMHPDEEKRARAGFSLDERREFVELKCMYDPKCQQILKFAQEQMKDYSTDYKIKYVIDNELIDLGGITLTAYCVPGHTSGSMIYVDYAGKNAFCGDSVNPRSSIGMFPDSPTVATYAKSLHSFIKKTNNIDRFYVGHRLYYFEKNDLLDILLCAQEIIDGVPGEPFPMVVSRNGPIWGWIHWHNGKRITYQKENIL